MRQGQFAPSSIVSSRAVSRDGDREATQQQPTSAPIELDLAALEKVAGGVTVTGPHGGWVDCATVDAGPHGGW